MFNLVLLITSSLDKKEPCLRASITVLATDSPNESTELNGGSKPLGSSGSKMNLLASDFSKFKGLKWNPRSIISNAISNTSHNPSSLFEDCLFSLNISISFLLERIASLPATNVSISKKSHLVEKYTA